MDTRYTCVTSVEEIRKYIGQSKVVAFDFETAPDMAYKKEEKAALDSARAHICGCSFSVEKGTGIYVPVEHLVGANIDKKGFFEFLAEFLSDTGIVKIAHNIAFESSMAYARGIVIQPPVYDTICAAQLTLKEAFCFRKLPECGLKQLAMEVCGEALPSFLKVTDGKNFDELDGHDPETVRYGSADSDFALRLYYIYNDWFEQFLPCHRYIAEKIESEAAVYIGIMKCNGVPADAGVINQKKKEAEAEIDRIRNEILFITGDVNIGTNCSTQAFKNYLYRDLKLPVLKKTVTGRESVDDESMQRLKAWCDKNRKDLSRLFTLVQEYRGWNKAKSTSIDGYLKYINPVTGCIHPDMFGLSTDTGRMNCRNPNLQNMPRMTNDPIGVRNFIRVPEGYKILSLDFSQIELRVGAFYCRDERMMETYRNNGDIHAETTAVIFGITPAEAKDKQSPEYKERRTIAKNVNFGTFYGLFPKGLQNTLEFEAGIHKTVDECAQIIRNLKRGYKSLESWQNDTKWIAERQIYSETWLGRRRYLPNITSEVWKDKAYAERCALNTPIQGTAADILKLAMARILRGLPERLWLRPILQIHDELVFIVPDNRLEEAITFVRECMVQQPFPEFDIPLVANASAGQTFGEMEEMDE
ncbi:MAG: bifunctional 3'-5' exonuclease/DNA polymerase [Lachnospiraceae bacterium]|nr:bifunctional 3'-5' exonuclease/DNA polymerase [Lachnospiraceae bacterium]